MPYGESAKFIRKTNYTRYGGVVTEVESGDPGVGPFFVELGAASLDMTAPCEYWSKRDGPLERFFVRASVQPREPFNSVLDLVEGIDEVNNFISAQLADIDWKPPRFFTFPHGKSEIVQQGKYNVGSVVIGDRFGSARTVFDDCIITDVRYEDDESLPSGFGSIEWEFTRVAPESLPEARYPRFAFRAGGTGAASGTYLYPTFSAATGYDDLAPYLVTYESSSRDIFDSVALNVYFAKTTGGLTTNADRAIFLNLAQDIKTRSTGNPAGQPIFTKPIVKRDKLGKGIMLNWADNFGDLTFNEGALTPGTITTILQNAQCTDVKVLDSTDDAGIGLQFVFTAIPEAHQIERRYWTFDLNSGADVNITQNDPDGAWEYSYTFGSQGRVETCTLRCFYFNDHGAISLDDIQKRIGVLGQACKYREPVITPLARGRVDMPDVYGNFGDLYLDTTYGAKSTLVFEDCVLMKPPRVVDNIGEAGVVFEMTFGKPYPGTEI